MNVIVSSKNIKLTEGLKTFVYSRLSKLSKFSSTQLTNIQVILDVDRHKHGGHEDAVVELVGHMHGKPVAVKESGKTFYAAFFGALSKMKIKLTRETDKRKK